MAVTVTASSHIEALVSFASAALWLVIIVLLHFIKPQLKPSIHMISEYALKPKGWIMQIAFFCIASSCFATVLASWPYVSHVGSILLAIESIAFAGVGIFVTDPLFTTKEAKTRSGTLHNMFSLIVIPLFPVAATVVGVSMSQNVIWASASAWLLAFSLLTWAGVIGFIGSAMYSARHKSIIGYFQRFMALTFAIWLIVISLVIL